MVDSVASSRSTSSGVRIKPRSWAGPAGAGHRQAARAGGREHDEEGQGGNGASRLPGEEQQRAGAGGQARGPGGGRGWRRPLEEAALRDYTANQGEGDGGGHLVGVVC